MTPAKDDYGWRGMRVRHERDGKTGVIQREAPDFMGVDLVIAVDGGGEARVRLNTAYSDAGDKGWGWYCETFSGGPAWLPLGNHSGVTLVRDAEVSAA